MGSPLDPYVEIWAADFEYTAPPGERPHPVCLVARELHSGRYVRQWFPGGVETPCPLPTTPDCLLVSYYSSAELMCCCALNWPFPVRILDLHAEFRCLTSGLSVPCGHGLLGALAFFGLDSLSVVEKDEMRQLAMRGGPYTVGEQEALLAYCQTDVDALAQLLPAMLPHLDLPHGLLRGRYMAAAARIEWTGIPVDTTALARLQVHWDTLRYQLALAVNRDYPVFIPHGQRVIDATTPLGAALLRTAATWGLDPYQLAGAVDLVWQEEQARWAETRQARRQARARSGLTPAGIARWERAGYDHSSWPGLDGRAEELALLYPAAFIPAHRSPVSDEDLDYAWLLWDLVRAPEQPGPTKYAPHLLRQAADLVRRGALETWDGSPLAFSTKRFEQYLLHHGLAWPRLASGALALDDQTFRDMAKVYPRDIGPIREVRTLLARLRSVDLAVGTDGRNRCLLGAFGSKTSRNQPKASQYIFGPSCWLRSLIQPGPGRALAYLDWSQQELAIAASLSGDMAMREAYESGDFYLEFAKMAGKAPPQATKATHPTVREQFKVIALGVLFGMSARGAARRLDIPLCDSRELLRCHHEVFARFWQWSDAVEITAMLHGSLTTVFGWVVHTAPSSTARSMRNFPMQANGAEMMRLACCLATERGIAVCGVVHDALLVEAPLEAIETVVAETQTAMREASEAVLPGFPLRTEAQIVRYPERYSDPRGAEVWTVVERLLAVHDMAEGVPF